ncbi:hypothetical protein D3C80_1418830 [compost metagenome]
MHKYAGTQFFCGLPERVKVRIAQVTPVNIRTYFYSRHFQLHDTTLHLFNRQIYVLQGQCTQSYKAVRMLLYYRSNMIIKEAGGFQSMLRVGPVVE